uniref:Uncharacterized protein n=1 Tax=Paramormyrops kingsleyae TaxID=1676925 RepID=A0A3B3QZ32_9TELE
MAGILPKSKAKGVDFCDVDDNYYIIRSDLGCFMYSTNFHRGYDLKMYSLHPSCQGGDHYLAFDNNTFYIIKGNTYRHVSDMSKEFDSVVYNLHPNCQGGDHYLSAYGYFYIIFKSRGVYHKTSNMNKDSNAVEYQLHPNCKDGLYYWGTKSYSYFLKSKDEYLHYADTFSIHPDVLNFLPGGLGQTNGPAFGKWDLIKMISNDSEIPVTWKKKTTRKVSFTKSKLSSIEHNWKVNMSATFDLDALIAEIVKLQFSLSAEYGGTSVNTENENWEEATEVAETVILTLQPHTKMYVWQYKLGLGKEDVLFCRHMAFTDNPNPPSIIPLPPANK